MASMAVTNQVEAHQTRDVQSIPLDVWIEILTELDPIDVLRLSQVSRFLYEALSSRSIWAELLRCTCFKYRLFEPSFQMEGMDTPRLQRACLGPFLWASLIQKTSVPFKCLTEATAPMKPASSVHTQLKVTDDSAPFLVPGGRFLLALESSAPPIHPTPSDIVLNVWDFGTPGTSVPFQPALLGTTSTGIPGTSAGQMIVDIGAPQSSTLTVAVCSDSDESSSDVHVAVIQADFHSGGKNEMAVSFRRVASLTLPNKTHDELGWKVVALHRSRLLLHCAEGLLIWDFLRGAFTSSRLVGEIDVVYTMPILFSADSFFTLKHADTSLLMWKLPELEELPPRIGPDFPPWTGVFPHSVIPLPALGLSDIVNCLYPGLVRSFPCDYSTLRSMSDVTGTHPEHSFVGCKFMSLGRSWDDPNQIMFMSLARAPLEVDRVAFDRPLHAESFNVGFFSSMQALVRYHDDPWWTRPKQCIYAVIPSDESYRRQVPTRGGNGSPKLSTPTTQGDNDSEPHDSSFMLAPLSNNWRAAHSCISTGRLLHVTNMLEHVPAEYVLADYLW